MRLVNKDDLDNMSQRELWLFIASELIDQRDANLVKEPVYKYRCPACMTEYEQPYGTHCPDCGSNECHVLCDI